MRALLGCAGLVLVAPTGCAGQTETYCDTLRDQRSALTGLAEGSADPGAEMLEDGLAVFRDLRAEAPADIRDEWDTFYFAWEGLADAFEAAGTTPQEYRAGGDSPGVNEAEADAIADAAAELGSARVVDAGAGIQLHAQDVCDVDLGLDAV
jgi:hypothetical protein